MYISKALSTSHLAPWSDLMRSWSFSAQFFNTSWSTGYSEKTTQKVERSPTHIAPHYITHTAVAASALSSHRQGLTCSPCSQRATCSSGLPFYGLHLRNPFNYMYCYSFIDPEGMEG